MIATSTADAADLLLRGRNADGGWGYYPGKSTRLEPTVWATLALHETAVAQEMSAVLRHWPCKDGLLLERAGGVPNHAFHGLALLIMRACGIEHLTGNASLIDALRRVRGVASEPLPGSRQDNTLQAWSWIADTFSWVEPTAWCLLTLKKWAEGREARTDLERVDQAERMLINRSCVSGGWNYGNADVLGTNLRPYVPTTAVALLALQDRRDHPAVERSVDYLEQHATSERSGTALGLASLALRACKRPDSAVRGALIEQLPTTMELRNHAAIALALFALGREQAHVAFTI